jgi:photosystem II stability/assembly factor-like uncharacterized protein
MMRVPFRSVVLFLGITVVPTGPWRQLLLRSGEVIVAEQGAILRTTDSGATWTAQLSGTSNTVYAVSLVDASTGRVVGYYGTILRTNTGGE